MELRVEIAPWFNDSGIPDFDAGLTKLSPQDELVKSANWGTAAIRWINNEKIVKQMKNFGFLFIKYLVFAFCWVKNDLFLIDDAELKGYTSKPTKQVNNDRARVSMGLTV